MTAEAANPKKQRGFPSAFTILALLLVVVAILTFIVPAGSYDVDADGAPIPGTYHTVEANPQRWRDAVLAPINGMYGIQDDTGYINVYNSGSLYGAIDVALFILLIGGFLGVTMKTGAIDAGISAVVKSLGQRGKLLITVLMVIFAAGGTTYGMAEESLAFYPLIIAALIAVGYDALTAVSLILLGAGIGVIGSTINPFATGIASGIAGIPLAEGIGYRIVILIIGLVLGIWYVRRYASRVHADPGKSLVADMKEENEKFFLRSGESTEAPELTGRRKLILALFGFSFLAMIVGVIPWEDLGITAIATRWWWFAELAALFMFMGIVIGLVGGLGEKGTVDAYIDGARDLLGVALVVGPGARHLGDHDQRPDHRHGALLVRAGGGQPGIGGVHQRHVPGLPAAVLLDPVVLGAGHGHHADHGAAGELRRRADAPGGHRLSVVLGAAQPVHPDLRRRHRRPGDRTDQLRRMVALRPAAGSHAGSGHHDRAIRRRPDRRLD